MKELAFITTTTTAAIFESFVKKIVKQNISIAQAMRPVNGNKGKILANSRAKCNSGTITITTA